MSERRQATAAVQKAQTDFLQARLGVYLPGQSSNRRLGTRPDSRRIVVAALRGIGDGLHQAV